MQRFRGFTLVELMITIAVFAIIAMMAAPSFNATILQYRLNQSSRNLINTLNAAKSKAALERQPIQIVLNSVAANTDTVFNWQPSGKAIYRSSTTSITFMPTGLVQDPTNANQPIAQDLVLTICNNTQANATFSKQITINFLGGIQESNPIAGCN